MGGCVFFFFFFFFFCVVVVVFSSSSFCLSHVGPFIFVFMAQSFLLFSLWHMIILVLAYKILRSRKSMA